jgi:class 3 adenylate cyclase
MADLVRRVLAVGTEPSDDEDTRLRKLLLLVEALAVTSLALVWGAIYWLVGATSAAAIPWLYVAISLASLLFFRISHSYRWFAIGQFVPYITMPFILMWTLGGFVSGSAVALWAGLAPLSALLLGHRRAAALLAAGYSALVLASAIVPTLPAPSLPSWLRDGLFPLNLIAIPLVACLLVRLFADGRQGALLTVRRMIGRYFSPDVAAMLLADPRKADLGGEIVEVSVLFADLGSYSTYAEKRSPGDVVAMLNQYFGVALPAIVALGGVPVQLAGDAVMAVFGAPRPQPDHAARACRAALDILDGTEPLSTGPQPGPRFHIGVNSGPALVGNIGSEEYRNFTAIGDTTNLAARLQGVAKPGEVVIGPTTAAMVHGSFALTSVGPMTVKGRVEPAEVFALRPA